MKQLVYLYLLLHFCFAAAGPSISGGADNCGQEAYQYDCTLYFEDGSQQNYRISKAQNEVFYTVEPELEGKIDIGICATEDIWGLGLNRVATIAISQEGEAESAIAQTEFSDKSHSVNLFQSVDGTKVYMLCKLIL